MMKYFGIILVYQDPSLVGKDLIRASLVKNMN